MMYSIIFSVEWLVSVIGMVKGLGNGYSKEYYL